MDKIPRENFTGDLFSTQKDLTVFPHVNLQRSQMLTVTTETGLWTLELFEPLFN